MNTCSHTHLFLLLTLVVSPHSPLLSCTAPDKQHQKQHSHQPQRKHPFTCSGIYLLNPPVATCVCVCLSPTPTFTRPHPPISSPLSVFHMTCELLWIFASLLWWLFWSQRSWISRWCQETFCRGGCRCRMCLTLVLIFCCHAIFLCHWKFTGSHCLLGLSVQFTSSFLYMPLQTSTSPPRARQRSLACPSSQIAQSNFSFHGVKISEVSWNENKLLCCWYLVTQHLWHLASMWDFQ